MKLQLFISLMTIAGVVASPVAYGKADSLSDRAGGGGKGFLCTQPNGAEQVYLADTFSLENRELVAMVSSDPSAVIAVAAEAINSTMPKLFDHPYKKGEKVSLGWMIAHRYRQLNFVYSNNVADYGDDNIDPKSLPAGCKKVQLAFQDIASSRVELSPMVQKLSWSERGFLDLHEVLISLRGKPGEDTTLIRESVESIAKGMGYGIFRQQVLERLKARLVPQMNYGSQANKDLASQCGNRLLAVEPEASDTPEVTRCREISAIIFAEVRSHHEKNSLPTLRQWPKQMQCLANTEGDNPLHKAKPSSIAIDLVGEGVEANVLQIAVDGKKATSKRSWFTADRTKRDSGFRDYGTANLAAYFVTEDRQNVTFTLSNYDDLTQTFSGTLSFADPTLLSYPNDSWFRMTCYAGPVAMGLDAEPRTKDINQSASLTSQPGCATGVLSSNLTRAKYMHDAAALQTILAKDSADRRNVLRYTELEKQLNDETYFASLPYKQMMQLTAELEKLQFLPAVEIYRNVKIIEEVPLACVDFAGE